MPKISNINKPTPAGLALIGNALVGVATYVASSAFFPLVQLSKTASAIVLSVGALGAFLTHCCAPKDNNAQKN